MSLTSPSARGEKITLVDGGRQRRSFTSIDDGINALMKIIENRNGVATGKIYNVDNPANNISIKELAESMVDIAQTYPEYAKNAKKVRLVRRSADTYYGKGYQDVESRIPSIENTKKDLKWSPKIGMKQALRGIFDAYRHHVRDARRLKI